MVPPLEVPAETITERRYGARRRSQGPSFAVVSVVELVETTNLNDVAGSGVRVPGGLDRHVIGTVGDGVVQLDLHVAGEPDTNSGARGGGVGADRRSGVQLCSEAIADSLPGMLNSIGCR